MGLGRGSRGGGSERGIWGVPGAAVLGVVWEGSRPVQSLGLGGGWGFLELEPVQSPDTTLTLPSLHLLA